MATGRNIKKLKRRRIKINYGGNSMGGSYKGELMEGKDYKGEIRGTDPRDLEFQATGNGEFVITQLQKKHYTLYLRRNKNDKPFLRIEVNGEKGFQIFNLTED